MGAVSFSLDVRLVEHIKNVLPVSIFFETGTFKGDTVNAMLPYFDRFITAELSEPLWKEVTGRFVSERRIEPYLGNSPDIIAKFSPTLKDASVLYWLDAHWCVADDTSGEKSQCPLLEEIHAIGQLNDKSIILIDDARLFLVSPPEPHEVSDWPSIDSIVTALRQISSHHELSVVNDVIIFYPKLIRDTVVSFARKYGVDWLRASQSLVENTELRRAQEEKQSELERMYEETRQLQTQLIEKQKELERQYSNVLNLQKQCEEKESVIQELNKALVAWHAAGINLREDGGQ